MGTNCAPLLADIFLYSYEAEFIQSLLSTGKKKVASHFNFTYRYIDDVLSINYPDFEYHLGQMHPAELDIKDKTESNTSASCKFGVNPVSSGRNCYLIFKIPIWNRKFGDSKIFACSSVCLPPKNYDIDHNIWNLLIKTSLWAGILLMKIISNKSMTLTVKFIINRFLDFVPDFGIMFVTNIIFVWFSLWMQIYKKRLQLGCIHHSISNFINNMDHMRISGTEPSSVILSQTKKLKYEKWCPIVPK